MHQSTLSGAGGVARPLPAGITPDAVHAYVLDPAPGGNDPARTRVLCVVRSGPDTGATTHRVHLGPYAAEPLIILPATLDTDDQARALAVALASLACDGVLAIDVEPETEGAFLWEGASMEAVHGIRLGEPPENTVARVVAMISTPATPQDFAEFLGGAPAAAIGTPHGPLAGSA